MARIRTIKPEFPHSESMGRVSRDARLLFIELWTICDDAGRTRGNSRMLASLLFPYDDDAPDKISGWIEELEREQCVIRYEVDGNMYLQVCKWNEHQKIDKPSKSRLPAFGDDSRGFENIREDSCSDRDRDRDLGPIPDRSVVADPNRGFSFAEKTKARDAVIAALPILRDAAKVAVEPLEPLGLARGAFAAVKQKHLSDARLLSEWYRRQLSLPDPVCENSRADLLLVIATGIYAAKVPDAEVKKTRAAIFVDVINKGRWRKVTPYVDEACSKLAVVESGNGGVT